MFYHISAVDCLDGWRKGSEHVLTNNYCSLVTQIENPALRVDGWLQDYCPTAENPDVPALKDVINTIFPIRYLEIPDRSEIYKKYLIAHARKSRLAGVKRRRWGTYFQRMIAFGSRNVNQLEGVITVLNRSSDWLRVTNPIHLSGPEQDSILARVGNPCLQYVQFIQPENGRLDLVAVYRNHDYLYKAFGNFIGLGALLEFVALHTGREIGSLSCMSVHAYSEKSNASLKRLARL